MVGCVRVGPDGDIGAFGRSKWALPDHYAWVLENPRAFAEPIPYKGAQQLFEVPEELLPVTLPTH